MRVSPGRAGSAALVGLVLAAGCGADDPAPTGTGVVPAGTGAPAVTAAPVPTGAPAAGTTDTTGTTDPTGTTDTTGTTSPAPRSAVGEPIAVADEPVELAVRPGSDTMYVAERRGTVRRLGSASEPGAPDGLVDAGVVVLDISDRLVPAVEEGLLGMTFSPDGRHLYLNTTSEGRTSILEFAVGDDGDVDATAVREVIGYDQPFEAHNGGDLRFGPDGYLYVFSGDGGFVADPERRGLDLTTLLAKILRIEPTPDEEVPYRVPPDNPYVGDDDALDEIWSSGLRNPWRASFDPLTGDLWIGDVGDFAVEEINVAWADSGGGRGTSFGWSAYEGTERFNEDQPADDHEPPFFEYRHGPDGCSVSAGERYRGARMPDLVGWFVYADFCSGLVRALEVTPRREPGRVVDLGIVPHAVTVRAGPGGELYVVSLDGEIHPIVPG